MDTANKIYQWGDVVETQEDYCTENSPIGYASYVGCDTVICGFFVDSFTVDHFPVDEISSREFEIAGFSGTIYSLRTA